MNDRAAAWRHQFTLLEREELSVEGVNSLGSYDEKEVALETAQGLMTVKGDKMTVKQLNLEEGRIVIEGMIKGVFYEDQHKEKRGLLNRFLKTP